MRRRTYNPGHLTSEELKKSFIVRKRELAKLLQIVQDQELGKPCQHVLLLGARGMGKTTLGLRFLQAVKESPDLAMAWQPVPFDEESYGVTTLADFWLEALRKLSLETGEERWHLRAEELQRQEIDVNRREGYALASVLDYCNESSKRIILFVENLDLIFKQIDDERALHALRSALIERPELFLLGSANAAFDEIQNYDTAFYEFFKIIKLDGLDVESCGALFENSLTRESGVTTSEVLAEQGRLETIRTLTGGNPRLIVLACEILVQSPLGTAFEDLEALIDEQTPYFKALIESLPTQARKVFNYLASEWMPVRARDVAIGVNLTSSHISAQLRQLIDKGYVRELQMPTETRTCYEVADRFYNTYYLMRFRGPGRERLVRLVSFLHALYGNSGMRVMYDAFLRMMKERELSVKNFTDTAVVLSEQVAQDRGFGGRKEWLQAVLSMTFEKIGPEGPVIDRLERRVPDAKQALVQRVVELIRDERWDAAESILMRLRSSSPSDFGILFLLGSIKVLGERPTDAMVNFKTLVAMKPIDNDSDRRVVANGWIALARLHLKLGDVDAVSRSAEASVELTSDTDPEDHRRTNAANLSNLGNKLLENGNVNSALCIWSQALNICRINDSAKSRGIAARLLLDTGTLLFKLRRFEELRDVASIMENFVRDGDDTRLRLCRILGIFLEGTGNFFLNRKESAITVWRRIECFVRPDDSDEVKEAVALCLGMSGLEQAKRAGEDFALLTECKELAQKAVAFTTDKSTPRQFLARILTYTEEWQESIAVLREAISLLDESDKTTNMLETLIRIGAAGYVREIHDLMAGTRLCEEMEPLWHAVRYELGESVEPLPAPIKEAVFAMGNRLNPDRD